MNWFDLLTGMFVGWGSLLLGSAVIRRVRLNHIESHPVEMPESRLSDPAVREALRVLLFRNRIVGNVDIREGQVFPAREPGRTNAMAAALMSVYRQCLADIDNPNLSLGYLRYGVFRITGLDVSDLRDIAQLLEDASGR